MTERDSLSYAFGGASLASPDLNLNNPCPSGIKKPPETFWNKHATKIKVGAILCLIGVLCYFIYHYRKQQQLQQQLQQHQQVNAAARMNSMNLTPAINTPHALDDPLDNNNSNGNHIIQVPANSPYNTPFFRPKSEDALASNGLTTLAPHQLGLPSSSALSQIGQSSQNSQGAQATQAVQVAQTPQQMQGARQASEENKSNLVSEAYTNGRLEVLQQMYEQQFANLQKDLRTLKSKLTKNFQGLVARLEDLESSVEVEPNDLSVRRDPVPSPSPSPSPSSFRKNQKPKTAKSRRSASPERIVDENDNNESEKST